MLCETNRTHVSVGRAPQTQRDESTRKCEGGLSLQGVAVGGWAVQTPIRGSKPTSSKKLHRRGAGREPHVHLA